MSLKEKKAGGIREVLAISFPLIMSTSGHGIRLFSDRVMLSHYSADAIAASMPAGLTCFMLISFFMGVVGYTNTFVAQYFGANRPEKIGPSIWQGFYLALAGGLIISGISLFTEDIFRFMGHPEEIQVQQVVYFRIMCYFSAAPLLVVNFLAFWGGRGKTWVCMWVEMSSAAANIILNYLLIFGHAGLPEMGIKGAAYATGLSSLLGVLVCIVMFCSGSNRKEYNTLPDKKFVPDMFLRMIKFGLPNGVHFFLDMSAFNTFVAVLGRMGNDVMEATSIAFSINAIIFMPMIGIGISVSILVGQSIGAKDIAHAIRSVKSAIILSFIYMLVCGGVIVFFPDIVLTLFEREGDLAQVEVRRLAADFLKYIAVFLLFDAMFIVYNNAIKGAGDTRWAMNMGIVIAWATFALPSIGIYYAGGTVYQMWAVLVVYVIIAGLIFYLRYRGGKWQKMKVIEDEPFADIPVVAESQGYDVVQ